MSQTFQGCPKNWPDVTGLASSSLQSDMTRIMSPLFRPFFVENQFSPPNGPLSPNICYTYSDSKASNELLLTNFSASCDASDSCWLYNFLQHLRPCCIYYTHKVGNSMFVCAEHQLPRAGAILTLCLCKEGWKSHAGGCTMGCWEGGEGEMIDQKTMTKIQRQWRRQIQRQK